MNDRVWMGALVLLAACGGENSASPPPGLPGIRIIAGADVTDSASARLTAPLIVEIHDATGAPVRPQTLVRFAVLHDSGGTTVAAFDSETYRSLAVGTTDQTGRTGALVQLGRRAGMVHIAVEVPVHGLSDTATYTITPAALAGVDASPSDTVLRIGRTMTLRGQARDAYGNVRPDRVTWSVHRAGVTLSDAGDISFTEAGWYHVQASAAGFTDTIHISAVPHAVLAAHDANNGRVIAIELDGSNRQERAQVLNGGIGVRPRWLPGTNRIVYSTYNDVIQELRVVDGSGNSVPFLPTPPSTMSHQADAAPAADGSWVYFAAYDSRCLTPEYCLFRSRPDGSSIELLGNVANPLGISFRPSASPDGSRVVFTTIKNEAAVLKVMDVDAGTVSSWSIEGLFPQWSPLGTRIAYLTPEGALSVVNSDGTGVQKLAQGRAGVSFASPAWSPDGRYIIRHSSDGNELVIVATGEEVPLRHFRDVFDLSWK